MAIFFIAQNNVAYAREQIGFGIRDVPYSVFEEFQKNLMNCVLGPAAFAGYCGGKQQQRRTMRSIQEFDLGGVGAFRLHVVPSTIRQLRVHVLSKDFELSV